MVPDGDRSPHRPEAFVAEVLHASAGRSMEQQHRNSSESRSFFLISFLRGGVLVQCLLHQVFDSRRVRIRLSAFTLLAPKTEAEMISGQKGTHLALRAPGWPELVLASMDAVDVLREVAGREWGMNWTVPGLYWGSYKIHQPKPNVLKDYLKELLS